MTPEREDELRGVAADVVLAVMRSVPHGTIGARLWWERATSALQAAANAATGWPLFASRLARKLGIATYVRESAEALCAAESAVGDDLRPFLRLCREEAPWIIVEARVRRDERRAAAGEDTPIDDGQSVEEQDDEQLPLPY